MMEQSEAYLDAFCKVMLIFRPTQQETFFQPSSQAFVRPVRLTKKSETLEYNRLKIVSLAQDHLVKY